MKARIQLDWTRLLGFDQVGETREGRAAATLEVGDRIGAKSGIKPAGPARLGHRVGAKLGAKPGFKPMA